MALPEVQTDVMDGLQDVEEEEVVELLDDQPMHVRPGLYIGSMMAAARREHLMAAGITDVLQVAEGLYPDFPLEFGYMNIQVEDSPAEDMVCHFANAFAFIDRAISKGGSVLVHCAAGISRSAMLVIGYLMSRDDMTYEAAVEHLREVRPWVCPNRGFVAQLQEFERLGKDCGKWRAWRHVWPDRDPLVIQYCASSSAAAEAQAVAAAANSHSQGCGEAARLKESPFASPMTNGDAAGECVSSEAGG